MYTSIFVIYPEVDMHYNRDDFSIIVNFVHFQLVNNSVMESGLWLLCL